MTSAQNETVNVATRLTTMAEAMPDATALVEPAGYDRDGTGRYRSMTFRELDEDSDRIARGLREMGVAPGTRLALLVRPGLDFVSLVFGLFKSGAVSILIDPGMGRRNLIQCLAEANPQGFIAIPAGHIARLLYRGRFPEARYHVTVGRRLFWGGVTLDQLRGGPHSGSELVPTRPEDPAAIIFTTGSTGPPKGVLYRHGNFDAQVTQIRDFYGIQPGEIDLPGFPLFGLFNCAMGVTAVLPDMDPTRPAQVDPRKILSAVTDWKVTQTFGSPAIWNRVGKYCEEHGQTLPTIRRVLSAGAPVPVDVLQRMKNAIASDGDIHTPYGATESLPVASISATEVLGETAERTRQGAGVCVGHRFSGINWAVIRIVDGPLATLDDVEELAQGEIGELIVNGPVVTWEYCTRVESNALGKIYDGDEVWHRMGDVGYFDAEERFWVCGRMAHRVETADGTMFTLRCEAIFNQHPHIYRSVLVGITPCSTSRSMDISTEKTDPSPIKQPVMILEPHAGRMPKTRRERRRLLEEMLELAQANSLTESIDTFLLHPSFPVDIRHNAKIFREKLAAWATKKLA